MFSCPNIFQPINKCSLSFHQIQGSKNQAEEGTLIILAAGERSLFEECQTCFEAMGKNSFYLGEVGNASKMNLVLQMMAGVTMATLAEGLSLGNITFTLSLSINVHLHHIASSQHVNTKYEFYFHDNHNE